MGNRYDTPQELCLDSHENERLKILFSELFVKSQHTPVGKLVISKLEVLQN